MQQPSGPAPLDGDDEGVRDVIARASGGDARAFAALVNRYEDRIYRFGFRMCGHPEDARDVLQDTFLAVLRHIDGYRGDGRFVSWLYKIASSACIKRRRRKVDEPDHVLSLDAAAYDDGPALAHLVPADDASPFDEAERRQIREALEEAVRALPENYRIVLVLRDFEHQSTQEVADALGLTETATKVRLHRARLLLRKELAERHVSPDGLTDGPTEGSAR